MIDNYKVTIIIPFHNASYYLERSTKSLMKQTFRDMEFIFVNDASDDDGVKVIEKVLQEFPDRREHVKIVNLSQKKGSAGARNVGLEMAKGEYLGWVDANDEIEPAMFEEFFNHAIKHKADIVYSDYYLSEDGNTRLIKQEEVFHKIDQINKLLPGDLKGALWNKSIKRKIFLDNNVKFIEGADMGEDLQALVKLYYYSNKTSYMPKAYYHWVRNPGSIMSMVFKQREINKGWIKNIHEISDFIRQNNLNGAERGLNLLKVGAKNNLLVRAKTINELNEWKHLFPESNSYIWQKPYPFHYKLIGSCIDKGVLIIPFFWIKIKQILGR